MESATTESTAPAMTFEEKRLMMEMDLRREELALARERLQHERDVAEAAKRQSGLPHIATIAGVLAAFLGTVITIAVQGQNSRHAQQTQFEASLILKAIAVDSQERSAKNLDFLVKAGLISDKTGQIRKLVAAPKTAPLLPARDPSSLQAIIDSVKAADKQILGMTGTRENTSPIFKVPKATWGKN